jgi:hypothetical protein
VTSQSGDENIGILHDFHALKDGITSDASQACA